ncbi:Clavaminate synthase-like protein [Macroventuria anomochaeta]|uniref:Clavaminate synthase-like protein n=1 Tax=Macroventuria anomochaeta TaxID=301207 RepID=A0ACB6RPT1_9PLEO|nr:Clavaminate synthase-like protein [Macroventuria anomochaeta]KAF2623732.1 Clavaminate synthase-like protein [Macroventuria anomochaeta]
MLFTPRGSSVLLTQDTQQEVVRQNDIGQAYFDLPLEEKGDAAYRRDFANGNYFVYRAAYEKKIIGTEVLGSVESVNIPKFSRRSLDIASKILTLFSISLELPEDYFSKQHSYEDASEYMIYRPRPAGEDANVENAWSRAHTDFGSLTLLWSQNVAWKYVPPVDDGITRNVGDTLAFWFAGYLKLSQTIHRVIRPPEDRTHINRLYLFYFVIPGNNVAIKPAPLPLLKRLGLVAEDQEKQSQSEGESFKVGNLEIEDEAA